jgi:hypothetical protein
MGSTRYVETSETDYSLTRRSVPDEEGSQLRNCDNIKTRPPFFVPKDLYVTC